MAIQPPTPTIITNTSGPGADPHSLSLDDVAKAAFAAGDAQVSTPTSSPTQKPTAPPPTKAPPGSSSPDPVEPTSTKPTDIWRPKKAQDWKAVHEESEKRLQRAIAAEERAKALEEKLTRFDPKTVETIAKERDEYKTKLAEVGLELDPEFNREFAAKHKTLVTLAKQAAGEKAQQIETLLSAPPSEWRDQMIEGIVADLTPAKQARLHAAMANLDTLNLSKAEHLGNASALLEQKRMQKQQEMVGRQKMRENVFHENLKAWTDPKEGQPVFQERDGDEAWNSKVKERLGVAQYLYSGEDVTDEDRANASLRAAAFDGLLESHLAANNEIQRLTKELEKYSGAVPKPPGSGSSATPTGEGEEGLDYVTGIMKGLQREGLLGR